ncbi:helix-turn-helix domain-containing protein [Agrobacterium sp. ST15.13.015]|uniref:helix-turn-helix domain-containing protein n=1 Tax=Agrobacterium sp. ST15.13.015 TaxID=3017319 RepID=UPI0022BFF24D|nr:helix-turn-helix domain-containing protein [Agrobacterium sp. ST15.13.015]MCZ7502017.1 hypothetical protein [Rhizobium rhizogenes]
MNVHQPQPMTELQRQHLAHKERQRRFAAAALKRESDRNPKPQLVYINPIPIKEHSKMLMAPLAKHLSEQATPEWKRKAVCFDAHIRQWRIETGQQVFVSCKDFIRKRSVELGYDYETMIGPIKTRPVARARHIIMWEIKNFVKPEISYPELGRQFGSRDHTSCLWAVSKIQEEVNKNQGLSSENMVSMWYKNRTKKGLQPDLGSNQE